MKLMPSKDAQVLNAASLDVSLQVYAAKGAKPELGRKHAVSDCGFTTPKKLKVWIPAIRRQRDSCNRENASLCRPHA